MIRATVLQVFRKPHNVIYGYRIQDIVGNVRDVTPEQLKGVMRSGSLQLDNYRLTSDNRLVRSKSDFNPVVCTYLLMNKNNIVAEFDIPLGIIKSYGKFPYHFVNITTWLDRRSKFSCARDVKEFFASIGIETVEDMIDVTHCVSLYDTFWAKRKDSMLSWQDVSPFQHDYSKVISAYALEGIRLGIDEKKYFSPVVSTDGSFPHTWKFAKDHIIFVKAGSKYTLGGANSGREPYSEYYASVVSEYLGFHSVKYRIRNHVRQDKRVDVVTECDCFTNEKTGSVTAFALGLETYEAVIAYCKELSANAYSAILDMLFLDCLLLNTDRHFSNIEFLMDTETLDVIDIAPIFDNNHSFLPRFIEGLETFERGDYMVRDGRSFDDLYQLVKQHKVYNKELISLKKLKLQMPPQGVAISAERLQFLNWFLQMQVDYLLKNNCHK